MKIVSISFWDNGNQLQLLSEALREYTNYDVLHVCVNKTYLYDSADIYLQDINTQMRLFELRDRVKDADFFIFSEFMPDAPEMEKALEWLEISHKMNTDNTIIRTAGSVSRVNANKYLRSWIGKNWMFAGLYNDWSISGNIGRIAPIGHICPMDKIPEQNRDSDKIRICFAPTKKEKGVVEFDNVMENLMRKYDNVEGIMIRGKSWKDAIEIKSRCNITFDQFMLTHYGNSPIESMYLGHAVLSRVSTWCRMLHPNLPIITVNDATELENELTYLIENPDVIEKFGEKGRDYVLKYHTPERIAKQWMNLIDFVKGGKVSLKQND